MLDIGLLEIGITIGMVGKVLLGVTVLLVHSGIVKERKIDEYVIGEMKREKTLAILGILFIVVGYALEIIAL